MKYRTLAAALLLGSVMFTSCVDEFSELNSDPSTITKPDIRFLFTKCEASFQPGDYAQWFGGFNDLSTWSQTTVSSGGNTTRSNRPTDEANGCHAYICLIALVKTALQTVIFFCQCIFAL